MEGLGGQPPTKSHLLSLGPSRVRPHFWTEHHKGSAVELRVSEVNQSLLLSPGRWQSAVAGGAWRRRASDSTPLGLSFLTCTAG